MIIHTYIETFQSPIKKEWLNRKLILDYTHVLELCFEYIETLYSQCDYMAPK